MPASEDQPQEGQWQQPDRSPARDRRTGRGAAANRARHQAQCVELEVRRTIERGEFDALPGAGKPIERDQVTGVLPAALQLRTDDLVLDERLVRSTPSPPRGLQPPHRRGASSAPGRASGDRLAA